MTTRTKIVTAVIIGVLVAASVAIIREKKMTLASTAPMKHYKMVVSVIEIKRQAVQLSLPYLATVLSDQNVQLSSRIAARIEMMAPCGSSVRKGEILVKLDQKEFLTKKRSLQLQIESVKAELSAKESALTTAEASHRRTKALLDVKGASQEKYEKERSAIAALQSGLSSLHNKISILHSGIAEIDAALSYAVLKSPINGTLSKCFANAGDISMPGRVLLSIESTQGKYLNVRSAESIHPTSLIFEGQKYPLISMQHSVNGLDEYRAYLSTSRPSGVRLNVSLVTYEGEGIQVPLGALLQKEHKAYCFTVANERANAIEVKIIARGEEGVVIEGVQPGEKLIIAKPDILLKLLGGVPISIKGV